MIIKFILNGPTWPNVCTKHWPNVAETSIRFYLKITKQSIIKSNILETNQPMQFISGNCTNSIFMNQSAVESLYKYPLLALVLKYIQINIILTILSDRIQNTILTLI